MQNKKIKLFFLTVILFATVFLLYQNLPAGRQEVVAATAPALKEGTYLTGQTLSVWPSWSLLGNALGIAFPTDPINQLAPAGTCASSTSKFCLKDSDCQPPLTANRETCVLHNPETGWSTADRRFSFACSKDSYAYRYIVSTTPGVYTVRAKFEDTGISPDNLKNFVSSFVSTSIFKIDETSGVCNFDQEISTMQSGACGDGKLNLNKGEQCDPPGRIEYAVGCTSSTPSIKNLTVCDSSCKWTPSTTLCSNFSHCGNGVKEPGEACDDGSFLNGKYNHCNADCSSAISSLGRCGDGMVTSTYEICDPSVGNPTYAVGTEKWALNKNLSCSWDCQNWGPYCGDTITQTQYGEDCDGSQTCSIDGNPGAKVCSGGCQKKDRDAVAWWRFENLTEPSSGKRTAVDASANANLTQCLTANCPIVGAGKYGHGFEFSSGGVTRYLIAKSSPSFSLVATSSLTVEAWIYPTEDEGVLYPYQRVVEKEGPVGFRSYDLEFNASTTLHNVRFNLWNNGLQTAVVDSNSSIATGTWTHVVGTYQRNGTSNVTKIYVNGVLENTNTVVSTTPIMAVGTGDLAIGKSSPADSNYFVGNLDEIKIYNRALSAAEVQNNYQSGWFCAATSTPVTPVAVPGSCGDNVIDASEACDRGAANNGHACTPTYGAPCSYCSADCQNTIEVQPAQYCGNGVIESPEKCEVFGADIFSSASTTGRTAILKNDDRNGYQELPCAFEPTDPHTIQKGTKSCADCAVGVVRNCVKCGVDTNGVSVDGSVINVLDNPIIESGFGRTPDPLFAKNTHNSSLSLAISNCWIGCNTATLFEVGKATKDDSSSDLVSYTLLNPYGAGNALISSDPACSVDANPYHKYRMYVNNDKTRLLNFPVLAEPQPWQYDLVLSPVVSSTKRAHDVRVVVSWVGSGDFYGGVLNPFLLNPQVEGPLYVYDHFDGVDHIYYYEHATGTNYYNFITSTIDTPGDRIYKKNGIWYHGFNSTPGLTSAEAFTIDTSAAGGMLGNTYSFYVRAPSYPIRTFKNTAKLKVDVYLPEDDNNPYHFGVPAKTYYFQAASPSDNQNARYWQVFNISKPSPESPDLSASNIIDINTIITGGPLDWKYITLTPGVTPSSPQNLVLSGVGNGFVNIAWQAPLTAGASALTSYRIYRREMPITSIPPTIFTRDSSVTTLNDTSVVNGKSYEYKVTARNDYGESDFSNGVNAATPVATAPTQPLNLRKTFSTPGTGPGRIDIAWDAPLSDGGSSIISYRIFRTKDSEAEENIATVPATGSRVYSDIQPINLTPPTTYSYKVNAVNDVSQGPKSGVLTVTR